MITKMDTLLKGATDGMNKAEDEAALTAMKDDFRKEIDTQIADSPCYACLFPPDRAPEEVSCATMGVLAPLVGVIGSLQAAQAIQLLTSLGTSLVGRLQLFDGRSLSWTELQIKKDPQCTVCSNSHLMP